MCVIVVRACACACAWDVFDAGDFLLMFWHSFSLSLFSLSSSSSSSSLLFLLLLLPLLLPLLLLLLLPLLTNDWLRWRRRRCPWRACAVTACTCRS